MKREYGDGVVGANTCVKDEDRDDTADSVERLMGNKPEARFIFIQERAEFAAEKALVDI